MQITTIKTLSPAAKPDPTNLGFGKYFTDHMFLAKYSKDKGWHDAKICPREALPLDPAASVLHYGQALFEGMKAFKQEDGKIALFRPEFNWQRLCDGAERLCMVAPPKELFLKGIEELVKFDQDWIPTNKNTSLYIRPTLIGTEGFLGVRPSEEFLFFVILSPVGSYYAEGAAPVKIWVETDYLRAAPGGLGATKAAANYAGSLKAAFKAKQKGYSQVLWLDVNHEYIEEVGTMNVFFVFKNEIVTPALDGTILSGGVRDSVIRLLKATGQKVTERKIKIRELTDAQTKCELLEMFGTGTAAVISPVGELASQDWKLSISEQKMGPVAANLYSQLTRMQYGQTADTFSWLKHI
jgi:branched-chain amino acid aminotransferase